MKKNMTSNTMKNVEKCYWGYVRNWLKGLDIEYLESEEYEIDGTVYKAFMWFSNDNGNVCRILTENIGGGYTHRENGEEVA